MCLTSVHVLLICVAVISLSPASVTSLMCYECFSSISGNCGYDFIPTKAANKSCPFLETICYIEIKSIKNIPVVRRDCGTPKICNTGNNCTICSEALCNSSFRNRSLEFHYLAVTLFSTIVLKWCLYTSI